MESYQIAILFLTGLAFIIALIAWIFSQDVKKYQAYRNRCEAENNITNLMIDGVIMSRGGKVIPRKKWLDTSVSIDKQVKI